jgi:hypothetical protein
LGLCSTAARAVAITSGVPAIKNKPSWNTSR